MTRSLVRPVTNVSATWSRRSTRTTTRNAADAHQSTCAAPTDTPSSMPLRTSHGPSRAATASSTTSSRPRANGQRNSETSRPIEKSGSGRVSWSRSSTMWSRTGGSASTRARSSGVGASASCHPPPRIPGPRPATCGTFEARRSSAARTASARPPLCQASGVTSSSVSVSMESPTEAAASSSRPVSSSRYAGLRAISSSWVPSSATRPPSSRTTRSARWRVETRWATISDVRPASTSRSPVKIVSSVLESTALVASSSSSTLGSVRTARASATRCRWPPERLSPRSPTRVS